MTNKEPTINVKAEIKRISNNSPYIKDMVCLIGAFETDKKYGEVFFAETLAEAEVEYGDDTTVPANAALKQVFRKEISGAVIVNVTDMSTGQNPSPQRDITLDKLKNAITALNDIEFDLLYVIEDSSNNNLEEVKKFANSRFEAKKPFAWICTATRSTASSMTPYETTIEKVGDYCIAALTQPLEINGDELSLVESGGYLINTIARLNVGNSLTAKVLEEVTGLGTEYTFGKNDDGEPNTIGSKLVAMGYFVIRCINPMDGVYEVVNSANANGLDMYMIRVLAYVVNEFALRKYLGDKNKPASLNGINMECNRLLTMFRNDLGLVENINYAVNKKDATTAEVIINTIQFAGIITEIDVSITVEVV